MEPAKLIDSSNQELIDNDSIDSGIVDTRIGIPQKLEKKQIMNKIKLSELLVSEWITIIILCFVNLINYMDRFTIAGVLLEIQSFYGIGNDKGGFIQTAFILSYMIFAPLFGYLGDRYSRKAIMAFGVSLWSLTTFLGSFMNTYPSFIVFRALVGIGEASYSTIAPTIISDMFVKELRSKVLALFYFAIPVGSGLGYIIGSQMAQLAGSWHWALRVTPFLGALAVVLIIFVMKEPGRGAAEGCHNLHATSWTMDILALSKNKSFMLSSAGFTCVAFVTGALAWWGPTFIHSAIKLIPGKGSTTLNDVALAFGVITMLSGILGVPMGIYLSNKLRSRYPKADPLICATGLLISAPLTVLGMNLVQNNVVLSFVVLFFAELSINLNWALVADILLYVVIPTRRSTAEAFQILLSHAFGDASSPYLIGLLSEAIQVYFINSSQSDYSTSIYDNNIKLTDSATSDDDVVKFKSLKYSLYVTCLVELLGGLFFIINGFYIENDRKKVIQAVGEENQNPSIYADDTDSDHQDNRSTQPISNS